MIVETSPINLYIAVGCLFVLFILILIGIFKFINDGKKIKERENEVDMLIRGVERQQVRNAPGLRRRMNVRRDSEDDDIDDDNNMDENYSDDDGEINFSKMGKKKAAKMQAKLERKRQKEYEAREREERKRQQLLKEQKDEEIKAREEAAEKEREEKEQKEKEEREKREYEEYLKMKEAFNIEEEGVNELDEDASKNLKEEFINYIKEAKVVNLDEVASKFNLSVSDVSNRLTVFLDDGSISGVIDDRGKFIYITEEEWKSVAQFINCRGRVSLQEIVDSSNRLISLESKVPLNNEICINL
ncbi:Winged helix-turn-helix DNA-binding domain and DDRGK domain containing protein family-containing protein [Strongyloides ratti]|uniref:DDRGK domain-containing protein 1 n=1 Tax=Strongyloides ratti TaxID=34506 RepID=A0A090L970_STRRB|nr:Winged helix-turn-helix DNA-binding domain and DDRGK domain containing protein family-containing protein [Strongyloides ratti]CEF64070.1 Winged helix-turn-helix DNA-binding domain and DDRGK domain containing protein family-containing protein [Strongyloides ratti]